MIINLLDGNREKIEVIDTYESILWTKKYQDVGGCVLVLTPTDELINLLKTEAKYISRDDDEMVCEIQKIAVNTDNLTGKITLTITGLDVVNILKQRIVWTRTKHTATAEIYVRRLILDNFIDATSERKIDFIKLDMIMGYPEKITKQVTYDEVLETVIAICKTYDLGFRFVLKGTDFYFQVYRGLDCSQSQDENSYVTFSKDFNNLHSFDYEIDFSAYKNVALVGGEGEGTARKTYAVGNATGINRYEMFVDAKDVSSEEGTITNYNDMLAEAGHEKLAEQTIKEAFDCVIDVEQYEYKVDYDLGYKVTVEADYGIVVDAKIVEVIECEDINGYRVTASLELGGAER